MARLAIVVQRYGESINGGAELHARLLAERLARRHDVQVLTSCAHDYTTWAMVHTPGSDTVNGVPVLRFAHPWRNDLGRARVPLVHKLRFLTRRALRWLPGPLVLAPRGEATFDGLTFLRRQGPHCEGLLQHLKASADRYDAVIFFGALYEPTALGIGAWGKRSILVPLLHDEKPMYLPIFGSVLRAAGVLLFNTAAERRLAQRMYGIDRPGDAIAGVGMDPMHQSDEAVEAVLAARGLKAGYFVYVGRIDVAKGCRELVQAFVQHVKSHPTARLVMVGQVIMNWPPHPNIIATGFVSEAERNALVAAAAALVIPSRFESLSMVLLEAMRLQTPVIANGDCEVLADHIRHSGAGTVYKGPRGLRRALQRLQVLPDVERRRQGALAAGYATRHCDWSQVLALYDDAIAQVTGQGRPAAAD